MINSGDGSDPGEASRGATGMAQSTAEALSDFQSSPLSWSEHLFYDMRMLYQTAALWQDRERLCRDLPTQLGEALVCGLLESFQVHERNLAEFFRKKKRERSFQLSRFLESSAERKWRKRYISDATDTRLDEIWDRASTHLAHMSPDRTHDASPESPKNVDIVGDVEFFDPIIKAFTTNNEIAKNLSHRMNWHNVDKPEALPLA